MSQKIDLIIQARIGSKRLPGKSLFDLAGQPLVARILERVLRCEKINDIVLAIPNTPENLSLREIGRKFDVCVYQGSENDLVERYYQAAKLHKSEIVCRLPADNPTPEPLEIDKMIDEHIKLGNRGFSTNLAEYNGSGYPDGIGIEVFGFYLLEEIRNKIFDLEKREHIHLNFLNYQTSSAVDSKWCPINTIKCPKEYCRPDLILDVNTQKQYLFMSSLYKYLYPRNPNFTIMDIIHWYDNVYKK